MVMGQTAINLVQTQVCACKCMFSGCIWAAIGLKRMFVHMSAHANPGQRRMRKLWWPKFRAFIELGYTTLIYNGMDKLSVCVRVCVRRHTTHSGIGTVQGWRGIEWWSSELTFRAIALASRMRDITWNVQPPLSQFSRLKHVNSYYFWSSAVSFP